MIRPLIIRAAFVSPIIATFSPSSPCERILPGILKTIVVLSLCSAAGAARAGYKDEIGFTKLKAEVGASLWNGAGVAVSHIEAPEGTNYKPDPGSAEFSGKTFNVKSGASGTSSHATQVGLTFYGLSGSIAPGVTTIDLYEADSWIQGGLLRQGQFAAPLAETRAVENHSWVAGSTGGAGEQEILRRFDYAIQQSGFVGVVALNNGNAGNVPVLLAGNYNGITVGLSRGDHSYGVTTVDGSGRVKPEIVAPGEPAFTSFATPIVSSAAALLRQGASGNAAKPETMKAILLAGATKRPFAGWNRTATRPLDTVFGAGQLNIYNSYHILTAGQQAASASVAVARRGWDWRTTTTGQRLYFFDVAAGGTSSFSVLLTWNRVISGFFPAPSSSLANLTLKLYQASGFSVGALVDSSMSTVDNLEHIWQPTLAPGRYAIEVTSDTSGTNYGLAWLTVPNVSIAATTPSAAEFGAVPGQFTFSRGGDISAALTLNCTVGGTAINGTDYASIASSVTFPAGASTATVPVNPIADNLAEGNETVSIQLATDPAFTFAGASTATVIIHDKPIDAWRFSRFTAPELANPAQSGDLADFENDGVLNVQEYAFALEPKTPDRLGLPLAGMQPDGVLNLTFTKVKSAADLAYIVEVSNDLSTWFSGASYTTVAGTVDQGAAELVTVRSLLAPDPSKRQFMRVRVKR